ncbi:uncharacterized protein LOC121800429 [Salvia splendens]|uniref:uncharacterized protein LOC121800429 n=1 Tax=Salvia splendens TaxID=180675 RepID=UPI001C2691C8|nr:uncharacterized protein LOC121800429 [Salvia splendens]
MESQQHALEILMDLRRLVAAHDEFLAKFGQHTEEASESLDERSPPQRWSPPPSVTQEPMGFKSSSMPRLKPPRFDGKMALDWISKVQEYYNHYHTPLDDRLYLTKYLFDPPVTDWFHTYTKTDIDGSWEDFLVAVYYQFSPDLTERADERQLVTIDSDKMKKTEAESTKIECESTEAKKEEVEQTPTQVVENAAPVVEEAPPAEPTECLAKSEADPVEENKVESQRDMKTEETAAGAEKIEPKNDVAEAKSVMVEELLEAEAKPQTELVEMARRGERLVLFVSGLGWPRNPSAHGCDISGILEGRIDFCRFLYFGPQFYAQRGCVVPGNSSIW